MLCDFQRNYFRLLNQLPIFVHTIYLNNYVWQKFAYKSGASMLLHVTVY